MLFYYYTYIQCGNQGGIKGFNPPPPPKPCSMCNGIIYEYMCKYKL